MPETLIASAAVTGSATPAPERPLRIVMADDDRNEHLLVLMAADEARLAAEFTFVESGVRLMLHLAACGRLQDLPDLIVLDLNMPGLGGKRVLAELKSHPVLWRIPVVVFSSSTRGGDLVDCRRAGAVWFEHKPSEFSELVSFVASLPDLAVAAASEENLDRPFDTARDEALMALLADDVVADIEDEVIGADRPLRLEPGQH